jgi:hypothetical protein
MPLGWHHTQVLFPQQAFWHFYNQLELLEYPGPHMALSLEYVLLYVLQVMLLNRALKIVSKLLAYQNNIFFMLRILEPCIYYKYSYQDTPAAPIDCKNAKRPAAGTAPAYDAIQAAAHDPAVIPPAVKPRIGRMAAPAIKPPPPTAARQVVCFTQYVCTYTLARAVRYLPVNGIYQY